MRRFGVPLGVLAGAALLPLLAAPTTAATTVPAGNPRVVIGTEGGFVAPGYIKSALPMLVGYGNGAVLTRVDSGPRPDVRVMRLHSLTSSRLRMLARSLATVSKTPSDGWGTPGVADVPNTYVRITYPGMRSDVSVFALSFTENGDVTSAQAAARKNLQRGINILTTAAKAAPARAWMPATYEAWTMAELFVPTGVGMANPASLFCTSMGGTLSIIAEPAGEVGYCTLADGKRTEEWSYFRSTSPTLNAWPSSVAAPSAACMVVDSAAFKRAWQRKNTTGMWLLPTGQAVSYVFRPVLPGEKACQRTEIVG